MGSQTRFSIYLRLLFFGTRRFWLMTRRIVSEDTSPDHGEVRRALRRALWIQLEGLLTKVGARVIHEEPFIKRVETLPVLRKPLR